MTLFLKDPGAAIEHAIDWDAGYLAGRSIVASAWSVVPDGALTMSQARIEAGRTGVTLAGGSAGMVCRVSNHVTLDDGSSDERTLVVRVEER